MKIGKPLILIFLSQLQYRNENQNVISNFIFQFIKKAKWHFGYTDCELTGIYIFSQLSNLLPQEDIGSYRDDGLILLRNTNGQLTDRIKKNVIKLFKHESRRREGPGGPWLPHLFAK